MAVGAKIDERVGRFYLRFAHGSGWAPTHSRKDRAKKAVTEVKGADRVDSKCRFEEGDKDNIEIA